MTAAVLLCLGLLVPAHGLLAQPALDPAADRFVQAWLDGDISALGLMMRPAGIRLHLVGEDHLAIQPRQVQAALREFTAQYGGGEMVVSRVAPAGGDPSKGFADLLWLAPAPARGEVVTFTLFVAFTLEEGQWRITEIRIYPPPSPQPHSSSEPCP